MVDGGHILSLLPFLLKRLIVSTNGAIPVHDSVILASFDIGKITQQGEELPFEFLKRVSFKQFL